MDNLHDTSIFEFNIDEESKSHLKGIAQWAFINAIIAFVSLGITVLSSILTYVRVSSYMSGSDASLTGGSNIIGLFITLAVTLALNITLMAAATNIRKGVEQTNQAYFETGITKLTTYFKITGILFIVSLVIMVLAILIALAFGISSGFR